jgi:hypothetical protein
MNYSWSYILFVAAEVYQVHVITGTIFLTTCMLSLLALRSPLCILIMKTQRVILLWLVTHSPSVHLCILASEISVLCYMSITQLLFEPDYFHQCRLKQRKLKTQYTRSGTEHADMTVMWLSCLGYLLVCLSSSRTRRYKTTAPKSSTGNDFLMTLLSFIFSPWNGHFQKHLPQKTLCAFFVSTS